MQAAQQSWELENAIKVFDPQRDALYKYDKAVQDTLNAQRPWANDPYYFKYVRISASALLKMVMHARSGGSLEVMGLMQGYILPETFVVTDAFRLPVEGTETRVNAQDEANEYMVSYLQSCRDAGRMDNAGGLVPQPSWQLTGPFLAVVIDPDRTISAGRVEIGSFRTFPQDFVPTREGHEDDDYQTIPMGKAEDFGAHANQYYSLETTHFKSTLDSDILSLLWNKYWVATLSQSPLFTSRDFGSKQMTDLSQKVRSATRQIENGAPRSSGAAAAKDKQLDKVVRGGQRIVSEEVKGLLASEIKMKLFQNIDDKPKPEF
ncbi:COP9 signalosome complex subunit 5 [Penicillium chermesinum]|nr:COP9 signalosome complex subunit 5 [Penicillium chermesinum]